MAGAIEEQEGGDQKEGFDCDSTATEGEGVVVVGVGIGAGVGSHFPSVG
jgi:hypothetical protein